MILDITASLIKKSKTLVLVLTPIYRFQLYRFQPPAFLATFDHG
jgi:hypothetical protein